MSNLLGAIELESVGPVHRGPGAGAEPQLNVRASTEKQQPEPAEVPIEGSQSPPAVEPEAQKQYLSRGPALLVISLICLISVTCSVTTGLITIAIPAISADLGLEQSLQYWPVLVYSLTGGTFLLLAGAVADVIGSRPINLVGVFFVGIFALACGLAQTGGQLIAFRALGGVALSLFLPTSVSLISTNVASGKMRNVGFSFIGIGQVLGYALGLVLGGVWVKTVGWRVGYYVCGGLLLALSVVGFFAWPKDKQPAQSKSIMQRLKTEIDWVGVGMASVCLALLAYVLGQISSASSDISKGYVIALLVIGILLIPGCAFWFHFQEKRGQPALIPNSLWRRLPFSTVCIMILFCYAEMQTMELLASLFFQQVQDLSAIQASIRILPSLIVGAILNFTTGLAVHRIPALWLVLSSSVISAVAPLLMAIIHPEWTYWRAAFPAQVLFPLSVDVLFTVALLVISEVFPDKDQALAGAVFNTVGQFGQSLGLAIIGVISNAVTQKSADPPESREALFEGYKAGFWTAFAWMIFMCGVGAYGLRSVGKVGLKRD